MEIKRVGRFDVDSVCMLVEKYWQFEGIDGFTRSNVLSSLDRLVFERYGEVHLAMVDGEPAGYIIGTYSFSVEYGGRIAAIDEFFVEPKFRKSGVGDRLFATLCKSLCDQGFARIELEVGEANMTAKSFYSRRGFERREGFRLLGLALRDGS